MSNATSNPSAAPSSGLPSVSSAPPPSPSASEPVASSPAPSLTGSPAPAPTSDEPRSSPVTLPPPSSTSGPQRSSNAPSSNAPSSAPPPPSSQRPQTSIVTASSQAPSTEIVTSVTTPTPTAPGETPEPSTLVVTIISTPTQAPAPTNASPSASATSTTPAGLQPGRTNEQESGSLSQGGKTAIAVVVPVVVVALLVVAGILLWRRRKQRKVAEEARRKEVEEYGFNPNHDPSLPAVGMGSEMAEDQSGYRGWGNTTGSNRKASTTLTSGMTYSDSNSNPGGYQSPGSPTHAHSDSHSNDLLVNGRRETLDSEGIAALGTGPSVNQNQASVHRGPSNASSSYSAANRSDGSGDYQMPPNNQHDYYDNTTYYPYNPNNDAYGAGGGQPIIRDVSARRNTRIENPSVFPQQGNSGIAQNF